MKLIAHRGNVNGKIEIQENEPSYIKGAIKQGFDAEIDVWHTGHQLKSGHDKPEYEIALGFLQEHKDSLWIHCKNFGALNYLLQFPELNVFWHGKDEYTITSKGYVWTYPMCATGNKSVIVLSDVYDEVPEGCFGVCSDFVSGLTKYQSTEKSKNESPS